MRITVNGAGREVPETTTLGALLALLAVPREATAVEVNRELVPRSQHLARALAEGDVVEIVTLVGGG